jgi:hypothetical protein
VPPTQLGPAPAAEPPPPGGAKTKMQHQDKQEETRGSAQKTENGLEISECNAETRDILGYFLGANLICRSASWLFLIGSRNLQRQ